MARLYLTGIKKDVATCFLNNHTNFYINCVLSWWVFSNGEFLTNVNGTTFVLNKFSLNITFNKADRHNVRFVRNDGFFKVYKYI
jgi:hypothetical protein